MIVLRKEVRNLYRGPEKAYSAMDFEGAGVISESEFLNSLIVQRVPFSVEEVKDYLFLSNIFKEDMNFDSFKKTFFPHLY